MEHSEKLLFIDKTIEGQHAGGKGNNLLQLKKLGYKVPSFVVVPAEYAEEMKDLDRNISILQEEFKSSVIQYFIKETGLKPDELRFAVRSSALVEDGLEDSFAGQFESYLNVRTEDVLQRIFDVIDSASSARVKTYLSGRNREHSSLQMAVIVQIMMNSEISGVGFGIDPLTGDASKKTINALYGLGEGLVSGQLNSDTFTIHSDGQIESNLAEKSEMMVFDKTSGTKTVAVAPPLSTSSSLTESQVIAVGKVLDELKQHFNHPQDIEFCFVEDELFMLQTRPVTTRIITEDESRNKKEKQIWDNSNIVESYPGHTLPLTFSFIIKMYEAVYAQLMNILGVNKAEIEANRNVLSNMLGMIDGRVYYNLLNWYRALALIPGFAINAQYMEKMMGVKESIKIDDLVQRSKGKEWLRIGRLIWSLLYNLFSLNDMRRKFEEDFGAVMDKYNAIDFDSRSPLELMALYQEYETTLLKKWKAPMVNDFFVMIFFGVLQKLVVKYGIDPDGSLHNDLIAGANDIISTEPVYLTYQLIDVIRADDDAVKLFTEQDHDQLEKLYLKEKLPKPISDLIDNYLSKWGNRVAGELKLETRTYKQHPGLYLKILSSYLRQNIKTELKNTHSVVRSNAEAVVRQKLKNKPFKNWIFSFVLKRSREMVAGRENLRYARTKGYGVVREIFTSIGKQFAEKNIISCEEDIFYLTQQEIFTFIKGTSVNGSLQWIVDQRKKEYEAFNSRPAPAERFTTYGVVNEGNKFGKDQMPQTDTSTDTELKGIGCSPGIVKGRVRLVLNPNDETDLNDDILVTLFTDPGWVTLFPTCSAIIVEKGSLLSHSAIVSREMNIPCIVAVSNVTKILKTGDEIQMDGKTGVIKILN